MEIRILEIFSDQLEAIGLAIKDVAGDGNCLFRAMADQMTGDPNNHSTYRKQICDYIFHNREDFEPFIEDDEPFEAYLTRMRRNATWGGHLEIQACCMLYQVHITIHQLNQARWELNYPGMPVRTIHFSYHQGQHYSSVRMIGDVNRNGAPQSIELQIKSRNPTNNTQKQQQKKQDEIVIPTEEELIIMDHTNCCNIAFIRQVLLENFQNIDAAVEFILIVGPDNQEFQREYLEKPFDPEEFQNTKPPITKPNNDKQYNIKEKERKNQQQQYNSNNNNKPNKNQKPAPDPKEKVINKLPQHESNRERKERLKMEKFTNNPDPKPAVVISSKDDDEEAPPHNPEQIPDISNIIVDLGSVQI